MQVLAECADSKDRIIEVAGAVYYESYTDLQGNATDQPNRTPIRDLDGLVAISWLDPETAEKIYNKYW